MDEGFFGGLPLTGEGQIHRIVDEGYDTARQILTDRMDELHIIGEGLLEYETLTGKEIKDLLDGKPPIREDDSGLFSGPTSSAVPTTGAKPESDDTGEMEPQPT